MPSTFDRLRSVFSAAAKTPEQKAASPKAEKRSASAHISSILSGMRRGGTESIEVTEPYAQNVAVMRGVNVIGQQLSAAPLKVMKGEEHQPHSPLQILLDRPNRIMRQAQFVRTISAHQILFGNAFVLMDEPNSLGIPRSLMPLPPQYVTPVYGEGGQYDLRGWKYAPRGDGSAKIIPVNRMLHFPYLTDPRDALMGVSPLDVASNALDTDQAAALYNKNVLSNAGVPSGTLRYVGDGVFDEDDAAVVRDQWLNTYSGTSAAPEGIAVLSSNFEYESIGVSARDMQWLEARKMNLAEIARALNIPLLFLNDYENSGLSDAGLKIQWKLLHATNVGPNAKDLQDVFTEGLTGVSQYDTHICFDFSVVPALQEDFYDKIENAKGYIELGYTLNEVNHKFNLGMKEASYGDTKLVQSGLVPVDVVIDAWKEADAQIDESGDIGNEDQIEVEGEDQVASKSVRVDYKGTSIHTKPTVEMAAEAEQGLEWRAEYGKGGTAVGVARARDIKNRRYLSPETVKRMNSYFARHEVDKEAEGFYEGQEGFPSAGRIAWALWGGDPGKVWAAELVEEMNEIDEATGDRSSGISQEHLLNIVERISDGDISPNQGAVLLRHAGLDEDSVSKILEDAPSKVVANIEGVEVNNSDLLSSLTLENPHDYELGLHLHSVVLSRVNYPKVQQAEHWCCQNAVDGVIIENEDVWIVRLDEQAFVEGSLRTKEVLPGVFASWGRVTADYNVGTNWQLPEWRRALSDKYREAIYPQETVLYKGIRGHYHRLLKSIVREASSPNKGDKKNYRAIDLTQIALTQADIDAILAILNDDNLAAAVEDTIKASYEAAYSTALNNSSSLAIISPAGVQLQKQRLPELSDNFYAARVPAWNLIGDTLKEAVRDTLIEAYEKGENLSDTITRVKSTFRGTVSTARSRVIARTETGITSSQAQIESYKTVGVNQVEWLSANDSNVRPSHQIDGEVQPVGSVFSNGLRRPLDDQGSPANVINCRCSLLPVAN